MVDDEDLVRLTLWVPKDVRRAMKARALELGLTDKGAWLMAARTWGVDVPDEAIMDKRTNRQRRGGRR